MERRPSNLGSSCKATGVETIPPTHHLTLLTLNLIPKAKPTKKLIITMVSSMSALLQVLLVVVGFVASSPIQVTNQPANTLAPRHLGDDYSGDDYSGDKYHNKPSHYGNDFGNHHGNQFDDDHYGKDHDGDGSSKERSGIKWDKGSSTGLHKAEQHAAAAFDKSGNPFAAKGSSELDYYNKSHNTGYAYKEYTQDDDSNDGFGFDFDNDGDRDNFFH
ncbi:hypothetical protein O181_054348 [Austropuccinia psidii MF-1]|uniref:Uncharacterized protein n=1 Tax=Austropuccinia psidii MF-1 TaxID=1389203 RepID=A0A9Q3E965_9BASI|nr:hypothetical protein [Austropuccinia psidii MF-1]